MVLGSASAKPTLLIIERERKIRSLLERANAVELFATRWIHSDQVSGSTAETQAPMLVLFELPAAAPVNLQLVRNVARLHEGVPLLVLTSALTDREVLGVLRHGASGCLFFEIPPPRLLFGIHEALAGGAPMSREVAQMVLDRARRESREMAAVSPEPVSEAPAVGSRRYEVLTLLMRGLSYDQIATEQGVSINTVRSHVKLLYEQLDVNNRVEAGLAAIERGWVKPR